MEEDNLYTDGDEEPLFADDLEGLSGDEGEDDPPPLPPPMPSFHQLTSSSSRAGAAAGPGRDGSGGGGIDDGGQTVVPGFTGDAETPGADAATGSEQEAPAKKKRKPMLTLQTDRVFSEKGLPYLAKEFPKLKFKGKGHEAADLKYLLQQYELWANRLYPKLTFTDVTNRIETLATKKEFKAEMNCMRRKSAWGQLAEVEEEEEREGNGNGGREEDLHDQGNEELTNAAVGEEEEEEAVRSRDASLGDEHAEMATPDDGDALREENSSCDDGRETREINSEERDLEMDVERESLPSDSEEPATVGDNHDEELGDEFGNTRDATEQAQDRDAGIMSKADDRSLVDSSSGTMMEDHDSLNADGRLKHETGEASMSRGLHDSNTNSSESEDYVHDQEFQGTERTSHLVNKTGGGSSNALHIAASKRTNGIQDASSNIE